jgi:hypothetical protein
LVMSEAKLVEYLRSARAYCDPHPDLTKEQLLLEMERSRATIDAVLRMLETRTSAYTEKMLELAECED